MTDKGLDDGATLRTDERGVSQVVGFVLMFAMAFIVLSLSMVLVADRVRVAKDDSRRTLFAEAGALVASAVREAVVFSDLHPTADFTRRVDIPKELAGRGYEITVTNRSVHVNASAGHDDLQLEFGGFDLDAEGIFFSETSTRARHLRVAYRNCLSGDADGICQPALHRDRKTLIIEETSP